MQELGSSFKGEENEAPRGWMSCLQSSGSHGRSWTDTRVWVKRGILPVSSFLQSLHALKDCWLLPELLASENFPHLTLLSQDLSDCLRLSKGGEETGLCANC